MTSSILSTALTNTSSIPRQVQLFITRAQPLHKGHLKVISQMTNPVVVIVRGEKSGQDKTKNPFSVETQLMIAKAVLPSYVSVVLASSGYIPDIIKELSSQYKEHTTAVYCGPDRVAGYRQQIARHNNNATNPVKLDVDILELSRDDDQISATKVRQALMDKDESAYQALMPATAFGLFNTLSDQIK